MAIEECAELIKALAKRKRNSNGSNLSNICEEIADVEIMIGQLRLIYSSKQINKIKLEKLQKLLFKELSYSCINKIKGDIE